ncbi:MAG: hypothetical protein IGQ88_04950 [Gloeomargaritaceae cyanobacterium C42_A2020_066]|nr:hypothetical protein [Gloeomargaritaceae cyanobacterium C42_A2020_066]
MRVWMPLVSTVPALVLVVSTPGLTQDWVVFRSDAGRFAVSMPGQPTESQSQQATPIGPITNYGFGIKVDTQSYSVNYSDIPPIAMQFAGADTIIGDAKGSLLKDTNGQEVSFTDVTVSGNPGKRLVYAIEGSQPSYGETYFLIVNNRLFVVNATVPKGSEALAEKFLSSFQVLPAS